MTGRRGPTTSRGAALTPETVRGRNYNAAPRTTRRRTTGTGAGPGRAKNNCQKARSTRTGGSATTRDSVGANRFATGTEPEGSTKGTTERSGTTSAKNRSWGLRGRR